MSDSPRRLQQIVREEQREQEGERLTPLPEERGGAAGARGEELSTEERLALGHLVQELDANRQESPQSPSLADWKVVMGHVRKELSRSDLTREERRALMADIRAAKQRGKGWVRWLALTGVGALAAAGSLWWMLLGR